ncbi:NUDIX domain-containing protein [Methanothermobacter sp.]|uniref:NUDIX domain-containing protein n=1 Tax=Methanothermobacter sp. TaxID=1884223 RepID=UPI003C77FE79
MRTPLLTVDVIIRLSEDTLVLVRRGKPPYEGSWAIPGGFVEYGETVEEAAIREALEETGLEVELEGLLGVYSDPSRDPRGHTVSICFTGVASGIPTGGSDAAEARVFHIDDIPYDNLAFDHSRILDDFIESIRNQKTAN